ncbi:MAG: hypothetical protein QXG98_03720, partial [Candidatus Micrarchaeia archaeon]
ANEVLVALNKTYQELEEALADYARGEDARFNEMLSKYGLKLTDAQRIRLKQDPKIVSDLAKTIAEARSSLPPDGGRVPPEEIEEIRKALGYEETKTVEATGARSAFVRTEAQKDELRKKLREETFNQQEDNVSTLFPRKQEVANAWDSVGRPDLANRTRDAKTKEEFIAVQREGYMTDRIAFLAVLKMVSPNLHDQFRETEKAVGVDRVEGGDVDTQVNERIARKEEAVKETLEKIEEKKEKEEEEKEREEKEKEEEKSEKAKEEEAEERKSIEERARKETEALGEAEV